MSDTDIIADYRVALDDVQIIALMGASNRYTSPAGLVEYVPGEDIADLLDRIDTMLAALQFLPSH